MPQFTGLSVLIFAEAAAMKVLQLVESAGAGVGRHVIDLAEGLLSRGNEVHLVYSDIRSDSVFRHDLSRLVLYPGFHTHQILMRRMTHVQDVLTIRGLREYLESRGPFDLVHCHSTKAGLMGEWASSGIQSSACTRHICFSRWGLPEAS